MQPDKHFRRQIWLCHDDEPIELVFVKNQIWSVLPTEKGLWKIEKSKLQTHHEQPEVSGEPMRTVIRSPARPERILLERG